MPLQLPTANCTRPAVRMSAALREAGDCNGDLGNARDVVVYLYSAVNNISSVTQRMVAVRVRLIVARLKKALECRLRRDVIRTRDQQSVIGDDAKARGTGDK